MPQYLPIVIIDPSMLFREGLRRILGESGFHAVWCSDLPPSGMVPGLTDEAAPLLLVGGEVAEASLHVTELKDRYPHARAVVLADTLTPSQFVTALRCGADTVVLRDASCEALVAVLRLAAEGAAVFPAGMVIPLVSRPETHDDRALALPQSAQADAGGQPDLRAVPANLSSRERDVLAQLLRGLSNKEIARELDITEATVKVHVKAIFRKARVHTRTQIVIWAAQFERGGQSGTTTN